MSNYCECGGFLGSGGVDGYAGRWCRCANPRVSRDTTFTTTEILINSYDKLGDTQVKIIKNLQSQLQTKDAEIERLKGESTDLLCPNCGELSVVKSRTKDALIKELIGALELGAHIGVDCGHGEYTVEYVVPILRNLLNSEAVKQWGGEK